MAFCAQKQMVFYRYRIIGNNAHVWNDGDLSFIKCALNSQAVLSIANFFVQNKIESVI